MKLRCCCGLLLLGAASGVADEVPQARFGAPEVVKVDWNTRCPRVADFNSDGLPDLALLNLDRSRVEILLQQKEGPKPGEPEARSRRDRWNPVLEFSRFEKQPVLIGRPTFAMVAGDFNGDGKPDIAYTTDENQLILRYQSEELGDWSARREFQLDSVSADASSLLAADLNGDSKLDLIVATQTRLVIWIQGDRGNWNDPMEHALSDEEASMWQAADLDGDGKVDLFCTSGDGRSLLVRLQEDGRYGEEWSLEVPSPGSWVQMLRLKEGMGLAWIQENSSLVQIAKLAETDLNDMVDRAVSILHAVPGADARSGAVAFGDITGDGIGDVFISEGKAARVWVFVGRADGGFASGKEYPALSGVESLMVADADGDGSSELLMMSPTEKMIGIARWEDSRLLYPETVYQGEESLIAMTAGPFRGVPTVLALEEKKPKTELLECNWSSEKKKWEVQRMELPGLASKVNSMKVMDADRDGVGDVALFSTISPMQIWLASKDRKKSLLKVTGLPDSLTAKLPAAALTEGDATGNGMPEWIFARDQVARAFVVSSDGKARVVEQFNAPSASARLTAAFVTGNRADRTVLLVDAKDRRLHELRAGEDGVFRAQHSHQIGGGDLENCRLISGGKSPRLLSLAKDRFEVMPLGGQVLTLKVESTFESELKDTLPTDLIVAPFVGDSQSDDLLLVDATRSRVLELFTTQRDGEYDWTSVLYFSVFQSDPNYRGKKGYEFEPHDYTVVDLNQDGRPDLCLLVHDRVLFYVQEKVD